MKPKDIFIGLAQKENHYQEGKEVQGQSCRACKRKHYSFPDACNDGWPMGEKSWKDRGSNCINFIPLNKSL